jgi:hypothetical protein
MSLNILDNLVDNYIDLDLYGMDKSDISLVKDYMTGQRGQRTEKLWVADALLCCCAFVFYIVACDDDALQQGQQGD